MNQSQLIDNVNKIIALNKQGEIPASFESFIVEVEQKEVSFEDAMGQDNIGRFDKKKAKPKRQDRRNKFKKNRAKARNKKKSSESK